jgi:mRNA interferase HicA
MNRRELLRHLRRQGCIMLREGSNHTVYIQTARGKTSTVPPHREIDDFLARKICRDLEIPGPKLSKPNYIVPKLTHSFMVASLVSDDGGALRGLRNRYQLHAHA